LGAAQAGRQIGADEGVTTRSAVGVARAGALGADRDVDRGAHLRRRLAYARIGARSAARSAVLISGCSTDAPAPTARAAALDDALPHPRGGRVGRAPRGRE